MIMRNPPFRMLFVSQSFTLTFISREIFTTISTLFT